MDADLKARAERVAAVAAEAADAVDREARFPHEALAALRQERLLSLLISPEEGGEGRTVSEAARVTEIIAGACGSTGMVYAMHLNQIAGMVRHADTEHFAKRRRQIAADQLLVASATTEIGIGGDIRRSTCAVEADANGTFTLVKNAPVISYGEYSDLLFVTARSNPEAEPGDQVLVCCDKASLTLEKTGTWDTLGFRGTCSPGYLITVHSTTDDIFPEPFSEISTRCMLPNAHIFWSSVWLGLATAAVEKARTFVQGAARRSPGVLPPAAPRLAELQAKLQVFSGSVRHAAARFDEFAPGDSELAATSFTLAMNGLKVTSSTTVVDIVSEAMLIVGIQGYRLDSPSSLGRILRDAYGAAIMVNNDRIMGNSAQLELVNRRGGTW